MMRAALLLLGVVFAHGAIPAELGRFFFTPAERAQLDAARTQKRPAQTTTAEQPPPEPTTQTITYSGIVRRNDGKATLWLNNRPVDEKDALSGLSVTGRVGADGAVTLRVPETGASINLKVGQRAELQTGRVGEARRDAPEKSAPKADTGAKSDPAAKGPAAAKGDAAPAKGAPEQDSPEKKSDAAAAASRDGVSAAEQRARGRTDSK